MKLLPLVQMWGRRLTAQGAVLTSQLSRGRLGEGEKSSGNCTKGSVLPWKGSASDCFPYAGICPVGEAELCARLSRDVLQTHQGTSSPLVSLPRGEQSQPVAMAGQAGRAGRLGNVPRVCQHPLFIYILYFIYILFIFLFILGILLECFSFCPDFSLGTTGSSREVLFWGETLTWFGKPGWGCFQWDMLSPAFWWLKSTFL